MLAVQVYPLLKSIEYFRLCAIGLNASHDQIFPAKTGEYLRIFPNFQNCACCKKKINPTINKNSNKKKHNSLVLTLKICSYILTSLDIICSLKLTVFLKLCSRKTVCFLDEIMSADKYLSLFSRQMEAIVYLMHEEYLL